MNWTHGALDVESSNILPMLLQQRNKEIDGELDVLLDLLWGHADVGDGEGNAGNLLQLELDGALQLFINNI